MKTLVKILTITLVCLVFIASLPFIALEVICIPKVTNKILAYVPDYMQAEAEITCPKEATDIPHLFRQSSALSILRILILSIWVFQATE